MKPIRIIQIGTGHDHAQDAARTLYNLPMFDFLGVVEENPDYFFKLNEKEFSSVPRISLEEALAMDSLDAVAIECEEENATRYAGLFADKGVHIYLDKPGSHGCDSFERLVDTAREKDLVFFMGYMYRYNPCVKKALELVRLGELGEVYATEAQISIFYKPEKREWLKKHKGGMTYFLGCHDLDMVMQFMGGEPDEVVPMNKKTHKDGIDCTDYGFVVLKYKSGVSFIKSCCNEVDGYRRRQLVVCGTEGTVEIKPIEYKVEGEPPHILQSHVKVALAERLDESGRVTREKSVSELHFDRFDRFEEMFETFAKVVRGEMENPYSYDYEKKLFRTLMKCCEEE